MDEIKVPIYLMTGFLESGKTSFLSFTIQQDYFHTDGKTLLILCEEGEEEYDPAILEANNTVVEVIENEEDFTTDRLVAMDILHQPERVIIEYNGMWLVSNFEKMQLPTGWGVEQQITCVDGEHEIHFYGYDKKYRYGYLQPLQKGRSTSDLSTWNQGRKSESRSYL